METDLLQALSDGQLAPRSKALQRAFSDLYSQYRAQRDWSSVADQATLVLTLRARGRSPEAQAATELLALLRRHGQANSDAQDSV